MSGLHRFVASVNAIAVKFKRALSKTRISAREKNTFIPRHLMNYTKFETIRDVVLKMLFIMCGLLFSTLVCPSVLAASPIILPPMSLSNNTSSHNITIAVGTVNYRFHEPLECRFNKEGQSVEGTFYYYGIRIDYFVAMACIAVAEGEAWEVGWAGQDRPIGKSVHGPT